MSSHQEIRFGDKCRRHGLRFSDVPTGSWYTRESHPGKLFFKGSERVLTLWDNLYQENYIAPDDGSTDRYIVDVEICVKRKSD
jgi:hypothetical protein